MGLMLYCIGADRGSMPPRGLVADETDEANSAIDAANDAATDAATDALDTPLQAVSAHGLTAWVGENAEASQDAQAALAFGRAIEALHRAMTVIPLRYGCVFADTAAVEAHLGEQQHRYRALLEELEDCVELSLRIPVVAAETGLGSGLSSGLGSGLGAAGLAVGLEMDLEPVTDSASSGADLRRGRAYLLERKQRLVAKQSAVRAAEALDQPLTGLVRRRDIESGWFAGQAMVSAHYLVPREQLEQVDAVLHEAALRRAAETASAPWLLSGPWPPFHFAALAELPPADSADHHV
ncbi:GvpL/GvpF family gas vesicle protein [Lamprobacter modestohalophilus]|uniref:GvpL/GvpF family gas vesicle protein n=1 Tax=Lamprobacter modestohalophilus TaxID=1064514 RepID=UPI002ADEB184|nr:GvpL/GvpF family gas vesicle protein [Lamprobacter modestohalophilus]MEA1050653.1 GvpL/GvpF family gas vesicle protein [Lamprobacter modestohalophilus]